MASRTDIVSTPIRRAEVGPIPNLSRVREVTLFGYQLYLKDNCVYYPDNRVIRHYIQDRTTRTDLDSTPIISISKPMPIRAVTLYLGFNDGIFIFTTKITVVYYPDRKTTRADLDLTPIKRADVGPTPNRCQSERNGN